jgi:chemotaxis response regulator CheB
VSKVSRTKIAKPAVSKATKPALSAKPKIVKPSASMAKPPPQTPVIAKVAKTIIGKVKKSPEVPVNSSAEELNFLATKASKKPSKPRKIAAKKSVPAVAPTEERNFIVGIGASAGGLEALSDLISALPDDLGVPYIVVQHLSPTHRSMMVPLLARETTMLVKDAEDGETPLANVIYVTPANWNIIMKDGVMRLLVPGKTRLPKPSATTLFNSMAEV